MAPLACGRSCSPRAWFQIALLTASALAAGSVLVGPAAAASSPPLVIHPGQVARLAGTDLYAAVATTNAGVAVYGEIRESVNSPAEGYDVVLADGGVAVAGFIKRAWKYVFVRSQPSYHLSLSAPTRASGVVTMRIGEAARVDGSALVLAAGRDPEGDPAFAAALTGTGSSPLSGSYSMGISAHEVAVLHWRNRTSTAVYVHKETNVTVGAPAKSPPPSSSHGDGIGKTITVYDANNLPMAATLVSVNNAAAPATPYDDPPAGYSFVSLSLRLDNEASVAVSGDVNSDVLIVGSDRKTYAPDNNYKVANCTAFWDGYLTGGFNISAGHAVSGCVHFEVPGGVKIAAVYFSRTSSLSGAAKWVVG